jgi:hypothetical protein
LLARSFEEGIWKNVPDAKKVMEDMTKALFQLIAANNFSPADANTSFKGNKSVIPIDLKGFEWLATATDNMIMMLLATGMKDLATQLKTDFFKFSIYRLAGGIDNQKEKKISVVRKTFSVQFMKFSAGNT